MVTGSKELITDMSPVGGGRGLGKGREGSGRKQRPVRLCRIEIEFERNSV